MIPNTVLSSFAITIMIPVPTSSLLGRLSLHPTITWGFLIYRTTYTPQSEERFPAILETIRSLMRPYILREQAQVSEFLGPSHPEVTGYDMIWPRYRPVLMNNPEFDKMPLSSVRSHFESWIKSQDEALTLPSQQHICLVIDNDAVEACAHARPLREGETTRELRRNGNRQNWWVRAVEAWPELDESSDGYDGTMRVSLFDVWDLWALVWNPTPVAHLDRKDGLFWY